MDKKQADDTAKKYFPELIRHKRRQACVDMDELRAKVTPVKGKAEDWIREDRERN